MLEVYSQRTEVTVISAAKTKEHELILQGSILEGDSSDNNRDSIIRNRILDVKGGYG